LSLSEREKKASEEMLVEDLILKLQTLNPKSKVHFSNELGIWNIDDIDDRWDNHPIDPRIYLEEKTE